MTNILYLFNYHVCGYEGTFYNKLENIEIIFFSIPNVLFSFFSFSGA